jgi:acyl-CoA synthetase (AMP-forming)/AMP-acid ligase II
MMAERLLDLLAQLAEADPARSALYGGRSGSAKLRTVTRGQLRDMAAEMAFDLRAIGLAEGDCLAVWLPNWPEAVAVQLAALAVGAHVVGVNTRYNVNEVAHVLRMAAPKAVVIAHGFMKLDLTTRLEAARAQAGSINPVVLVATAPGGDRAPDLADYDSGAGAQVFPSGRGRTELKAGAAPGLAVAFTTSGSTGMPKIAAHHELAVTEHALAVARRMRLHPGDVVLGALPLSGVFGFVAILAGLVSGASVLMEPVFDPDLVLADMLTVGVTHIAAADDLIGRLADAWKRERAALPLAWIGIADFEGRSKALACWAEHEFGAFATGVYGSSELFALVMMWPEDTPPDVRWLPGGEVISSRIEVRVADPVTDRPLPDGEEGEMQFRGPNVVDRYLGGAGGRGDNLTADGWFHSGDLGRTVRGGLQFICRIGDALRLRGFLVDPAEIETRLNEHPSVRLTKVVGIPGRDGGTDAVAFVVPAEAARPDEQELMGWCAMRLARFKVPARVHFVDAMPTTSGTNGTKIRTMSLRKLAIERRDEEGR